MPPTYRAWGIVAVICGLLLNLILGVPTAIVGLRAGAEVPRLWESGDVQAAVRASRRARSWLIASGVLDLLGIILTIVIYTSGNGGRG
jgi:Interferon-induced transmembrane protein